MNLLQELLLLPEFAIACRGSNRIVAPPKDIVQHEAPWRKCAFFKKGTTILEAEWEDWEVLSKRQKVRPSHACRINTTVFAGNAGEGPDAVSPFKNTLFRMLQPYRNPMSIQTCNPTRLQCQQARIQLPLIILSSYVLPRMILQHDGHNITGSIVSIQAPNATVATPVHETVKPLSTDDQ